MILKLNIEFMFRYFVQTFSGFTSWNMNRYMYIGIYPRSNTSLEIATIPFLRYNRSTFGKKSLFIKMFSFYFNVFILKDCLILLFKYFVKDCVYLTIRGRSKNTSGCRGRQGQICDDLWRGGGRVNTKCGIKHGNYKCK